jgi:ubiquinone/menaquinone biosynthesis C-methylase UbiE
MRPEPQLHQTEDEARLAHMTNEELVAWENRGIKTIDRSSDRLEAEADERQDVGTSLSFPLHWTSAVLAWEYLFDVAIAGELLAARPDDLVLDFAAGTCWATELLTRLGLRPVALDLSAEMMRRGRRRLASDSRIEFRDTAAFVVGRGQALPFRDESFDATLCLNALHHQPLYERALGEIFRVLKPGGRAVFSEPGSAHAQSALSDFRMREESIIEKSISLAHIRRIAHAVGFTRMSIVPLRSSRTYTMPYTASIEDGAELQRLWGDTLRHAPREHARFCLHKGEDPPADTYLPPARLTGHLHAAIAFESTRQVAAHGQPFTDRLRITNTGPIVWRANGRRFGGQVTCGVKVHDSAGTLIREDLGRTPLPHDLPPGASITLSVAIPGVLAPGRYELRYDMVVEGVTWFEFQGSQPARRALEVVVATTSSP